MSRLVHWDRFGSIGAPWWDDKPVAVVGCGPSLVGFDFERLRGRFHVLAVKGAMFDIPWADAGFGLDLPRFREWRERLGEVTMPVYWAFPPGPPGQGPQLGTAEGLPPTVVPIRRIQGRSLSHDPSAVYNGGTSGYGALGIAVLKRAREIMLLGFDYRKGDDWRGRYNSESYRISRNMSPTSLASWASAFDEIVAPLKEAGVVVVNVSPETMVDAFPRYEFDQAAEYLDRVRAERLGLVRRDAVDGRATA